jgi:O-methyltransferase involved in polyketide biosynthesis
LYREREPPSINRLTDLIWEGVTNYLTEAAVDATLRWCSRAARESLVLFTYVDRGILTHPGAYVGTDRLCASLATVGEAFPSASSRRGCRNFCPSEACLS